MRWLAGSTLLALGVSLFVIGANGDGAGHPFLALVGAGVVSFLLGVMLLLGAR